MQSTKARRLILWMLVGIVLFGAVGLVLVHLPPARSFAWNRLTSEIRTRFGLEIAASDFRYNLPRFSFEADDVTISSANTASPPLLAADSVRMNISFWSLFQGVPTIQEAVVEGASIEIETGQGPDTETLADASSVEYSLPVLTQFVQIDSLRADGTRFTLANVSGSTRIDAAEWQLNVTGDGQDHRVSLNLNDGRVESPVLALTPIQLTSTVELTAQEVRIESFEALSSEGSLVVTGMLSNPEAPRFDLEADLVVDLARALAAAGSDYRASGLIQNQAQIRNGLGDLEVIVHTAGRGLSVETFEDLELESDWAWERATNRIGIESLSLTSGIGRIELSGNLDVSGTGPNQLTGGVQALDLEQITEYVGSPARINSLADGIFSASWNGDDWTRGSASLQTHLEASAVAIAESEIPLSGDLQIDFQDGAIQATTDRLVTFDLTLAGNLAMADSELLSGELRAETADLALTLDSIARFTGARPEWLASDGYPSGPGQIGIAIGGTRTTPEAQFEVEFPDLDFGNVRGASVVMLGSYTAGSVELESASLDWQGQTLGGRGRIDLGTTPANLELTAEGSGVSLQAVLEAMDASWPVDGRFDFASSIGGTVATPLIEADLRGTGVNAYSAPLGDLSAHLILDGSGLVTDFALLPPEAGAGGLVAGNLGYDSDIEEFTLHLEGSDFDVATLAAGVAPELGGALGFVADGSGSLREPARRIDLSLRVEDGFYGPMELGDLVVNGSLVDDRLELRAELPMHGIAALSEVELQGGFPTNLEIGLPRVDLTALNPILPPNAPAIGGLLRGAAITANGELLDWRSGQARLELAGSSVTLGDSVLSTEGPMALAYDDGWLRLDPVILVTGGERLELGGEMPLRPGPSEGRVRAEGSLNLASLLSALEPESGIDAEGMVLLDLELAGSLADIRPTLAAQLTDGVLVLPSVPGAIESIEASLRVTGGQMTLELGQATWNDAAIMGTVEVPLFMFADAAEPPDSSNLARLDATIAGLDLRSIPGIPGGIEGTTSATLNLAGSELNLDAIEGQVRLERLEGSFEQLNFEQNQPIVLRLADQRVTIENFDIAGPETRLSGTGSFGLESTGPIDLDFAGETNTLFFFSESGALESSGRLTFDVSLRGTPRQIEPTGELRLEDAALSLADPEIQLTAFNTRLVLSPDTLTLENASGMLNGGRIEAQGTMRHRAMQPTSVTVDLRGEDIFFEAPEGLRTLSSLELALASSDDDLISVTGTVGVLEGSYTRDLDLEAALLDYVVSRSDPELLSDPDPVLARIRYDVAISTNEPLIIENNVVHAEAEANLRLVGNYYRPGLIGRVNIQEGGEIEVRDTRFVLEASTVDFGAPNRIEPLLAVLGRTEYRGYDITIRLDGGGTDLSTTLTSNPPLSEPNIVSLLLTGRTLNEVRGAELNVAQEQALFYVTGAVANRVTRGAERALGLSRVRIEPNLIANESDPGARLTVGQNVTRDLELVYSMNLADSNDQIWIAEYGIGPRLLTRGVKQEDNSYRLEMRHDLTFGVPRAVAGSANATTPARILGVVDIVPPVFEERDLLSVFDLRAGDRYSFLEVRSGVERVEDFLVGRGYLEARARVERAGTAALVDLHVEVTPGPRVQLEFRGIQPSGRTRDRVREIWTEGGFDDLRGRRAAQAIRSALISDGYLEARTEYVVASTDGAKTVTFTASPGSRYRSINITFDGIPPDSDARLESELRNAGLWNVLHTEPDRVRNFIETRYRAEGYRNATVAPFRYAFDPDRSRADLTISVSRGPLYGISGLRFEGNEFFDGDTLTRDLPLAAGGAVDLADLDDAERTIEDLYWRNGFNAVVVERSLTARTPGTEMEIGFSIRENARSFVGDVEILGNRKTSENFVRSQLAFGPDEPLNFEQLNATRRNLYDTGAYSLVELQTSALGSGDSPRPGELPGAESIRVRVSLEEVAPYTFRYGGFYDTERGPGIIADFRRRNLWGTPRVAGISGRYDGELHEIRTYFSQPAVPGLPAKTNLSAFLIGEVDGVQTTDRRGVSIQQEVGLGSRFLLSYGYRYENAHTVRPADAASATPALDERLNIAPLTLTLSRDTRDDLLDASSGSFTSHSFEYASSRFGSDVALFKYFGQAFRYFPLSAPGPIAFSGGRTKPRVVYASGVRFGLAAGLRGDPVAAAERFFSGGGTTVRGYQQDRLGPADALGDPLGGNAVFTLNNEIRFPIYRILEGVGFLDAGNVYSRIGETDFFDVRASAGFGLRLRTPYFLLRADYGAKLDRGLDEKAGTFYFSIGQAF